MNKKKSFFDQTQFWGFTLLIVLGLSIISIDLFTRYGELNQTIGLMRQEHLNSKKEIINREVRRVVDYIHIEKDRIEHSARSNIKNRVNEAHAIAQNIYHTNKSTKDSHEIQKLILQALRPIRFDSGNGYFFAAHQDGAILMHSDKPEMEGESQLDPNSKFILKDALKTLDDSGEGYYEYNWSKPGVTNNTHKKISYLKSFEPYNWFIGTGYYAEDTEIRIKKALLQTISKIRFGKEGYIFVNRLNGDALVSNGKVLTGTKKLWEIYNDDSEKVKDIFNKGLNAALMPEGDFVYYTFIKLTSPKVESPKVSFLIEIPGFEWMIGAGLYLDDIEADITLMRTEIDNRTRKNIAFTSLSIVGILLIVLVLFRRLNRSVRNDFNLLTSSIDLALVAEIPVDCDLLEYAEHGQVAKAVNRMLLDLEKNENSLRQSEEKYRGIFNESVTAICVCDTNKIIIDVNQATANLTGYSRDELIGMSTLEVEVDPVVAQEAHHQLASGGRLINFEHDLRMKNGQTINVLNNSRPLTNANGSIVAIQSSLIDITEYRQATKALQQASLIVKNSPVVLFRWKADENWTVELVSENVTQFGYTTEDFLSGKIIYAKIIHPDDRERVAQEVLEYSASGASKFNQEYRILAADGEVRWTDDRTVAYRDADGNITHYDGIVIDITKRKRMEIELQENQKKFQRMVDGLGDKFVLYSHKGLTGELLYVSGGVSSVFGVKKEDVINKPWNSQVNWLPESLAIAQSLLIQQIEGKINFTQYEMCFIHPDGKKRTLSLASFPVRDEEGNILSIEGIAENITEQKLAEIQLIEARQQADTANLAKSEFLANMSHEIRTPMNAVIGMGHLLQKTDLSSQQQEYLSALQLASKSLLGVINNVLDFSKIEAGKVDVRSLKFCLADIMQDIYTLASLLAKDKEIEVHFSSPEKIPKVLIGDSVLLVQVLTNLVSNAVEFTDKGEITISVKIIQQLSNRVWLKFSVKDTGSGIEQALLKELFQPFTQVNNSRTRQHRGTGLGLAISRHLLLLMGGKIWADSVPGKGSNFFFTVDFGLSSEDCEKDAQTLITTDAMPMTQLDGIHILLAEDDKLNQIVASKLLESYGLQVTLVENGREALEAVQQQSFDIVLMDIQMPEMNGHEATVAIRKDKRFDDLPIIAMTAYAIEGEKEKCLAVGINDFITKPFEPDALYQLIRKWTTAENIQDNSQAEIKENLNRLLALVGEPSTLNLLDEVLELVPDRSAKLNKSLSMKDWDAAKNLAHLLKGSLNIYGSKKLFSLISRIEDGADLDSEAMTISRELDKEFSLAMVLVRELREKLEPSH